MAGLDPAIPLNKSRPCHIIGIAGFKPGDDGESSIHPNVL
jgi:hypothetical protein